MSINRPRQPSAGHIPRKINKNPSADPNLLQTETTIDPEAQALLDQLKKQRQQLEAELERVLEATKMSKNEFDQFTNDPKNFTPKEWQQLEKAKGDFSDQLTNIISKEGMAFFEKKIADKAAKAQRSKSVGARKKWIPM